jgi:hypothetical protein
VQGQDLGIWICTAFPPDSPPSLITASASFPQAIWSVSLISLEMNPKCNLMSERLPISFPDQYEVPTAEMHRSQRRFIHRDQLEDKKALGV